MGTIYTYDNMCQDLHKTFDIIDSFQLCIIIFCFLHLTELEFFKLIKE